jgi:hypothetical protein
VHYRFSTTLPLSQPPSYRGAALRVHYAIMGTMERMVGGKSQVWHGNSSNAPSFAFSILFMHFPLLQAAHVRCPFRVLPSPPDVDQAAPVNWRRLCEGLLYPFVLFCS